MELNWSTFLLEIVNFLVLVWILKRFLYQPVLEMIARRRAGIEDRLAESKRLRDEAEALKAEYENRLADWEQERQQARDTLAQEFNEQRARQTEQLQTMLAQEREKAQVASSRQRAEAARQIEHRALRQSAQFTARLLSQAVGPELEARLLDLLLDGLSTLSSDHIAALKTQWGEPPKAVMVASAYPVSGDQRQNLEKTLTRVTGLSIPVHYEQKPELLAGLRVTIGAWVLHANVQDELKGFTEFTHAAR